ncbi:MAG: hypothetical protein WAR80_01855 [Ferruginibacter sp.]
MIRHLKTFFYPAVLTYTYNYPKELVIAKITEVLKREATLFTSNDMTGRFRNPDTFVIDTVSFAYTRGVKYGSMLVCEITESEKGIINIKTKAKPALVFYFLFFLAIILGLFYLYNFLQTSLTTSLCWSLGLLIVGPAICIGFSNVAIYSVRERYLMYIDKELKT